MWRTTESLHSTTETNITLYVSYMSKKKTLGQKKNKEQKNNRSSYVKIINLYKAEIINEVQRQISTVKKLFITYIIGKILLYLLYKELLLLIS